MVTESSDLFENVLIEWYRLNKRDLPWRETTDPYRIWVSEIILQQTRVAQGLVYYHRFLERFPSIPVLAAAGEEEVLLLWQGLGYYSRARNLHAAAKEVVERFNGKFPSSYKDVRSLKGVGEYTAAAILSFSGNLPHAVVDGNVYRVLSRLFAVDLPIDSTKGKRYFAELAQSLLPKGRAAIYNQALMEFGAIQCVPGTPDCAACSLQARCEAFAQKRVPYFPVKEKTAKKRDRYFTYLYIHAKGRLCIRRRTDNDIWKGLFEFPVIESDRLIEPEELGKEPLLKGITGGIPYIIGAVTDLPAHLLSHQTLYARFVEIEVEQGGIESGHGLLVIDEKDMDNYAMPRLLMKYLEKKNG